MDENALIPASIGSDNDDMVLAVAGSSGKFFPRLQLCQSQSKLVPQRKVARGGNYAFVDGDNVVDLGDEVEIVVLAGRAKAMRIDDEVILSYFDKDSDEFKAIQAESDNRDSGCMFGPEFLLYIPKLEKFATYFMASKTARREAANVHARRRKQALLKSTFIETKKYSWFGPLCQDLSTPVQIPDDMSVIQEAVTRFENEKSSEIETAEEDTGRER